MVMSWIYSMMLLASVIFALISGNGSALAAATAEGAQAGITLAISVAGSLCLWTGVGKLIEHAGLTASLSRLEAAAAKMKLPMDVKTMAETNWEESWKENYPPVPVGEKLEVIPYWMAQECQPDRLPVILDPGLTFGTGAHPSTQMVMETMETLGLDGWNCLDLGSGSGILSIAALRLGAKSAAGVDVDPKAEDIARENAAYNGYAAPEFTALTGNVTQDRDLMAQLAKKEYDLVLVNIVADVIIGLSPVLPQFLTQDSILICSGILDSRLQDVLDALDKVGLAVVQTRAKEDWRCVMAKRRTV